MIAAVRGGFGDTHSTREEKIWQSARGLSIVGVCAKTALNLNCTPATRIDLA